MKTKKIKLSMGEWAILVLLVAFVGIMVFPGVTQATQEKKLSDLVMRLHEVRAAVALYKADHAGLYPGQRNFGGNIAADAFADDLTTTTALGQKPYLAAMAKNPYIADPVAARRVLVVNGAEAKPAATGNAGWWFNTATGQFCASDSEFHKEY